MKYLIIALLLFSCAEKKEIKRPNVEHRQTEIKAEIKQLKNSITEVDTYKMPEQKRDSVIQAEATINRKIVALEMEYDSLANLVKKFKIDSVK